MVWVPPKPDTTSSVAQATSEDQWRRWVDGAIDHLHSAAINHEIGHNNFKIKLEMLVEAISKDLQANNAVQALLPRTMEALTGQLADEIIKDTETEIPF